MKIQNERGDATGKDTKNDAETRQKRIGYGSPIQGINLRRRKMHLTKKPER